MSGEYGEDTVYCQTINTLEKLKAAADGTNLSEWQDWNHILTVIKALNSVQFNCLARIIEDEKLIKQSRDITNKLALGRAKVVITSD